MSPIGKKFVLVGVAVIINFLIGEVVIRVLPESIVPELAPAQPKQIDLTNIHQPSDNPRLFYEPIPGVYDINKAGYRGTEYPPHKPDGVTRIVGVGNSTQFGMGVDEADTYLRQVEVLQNADGGTPVEVVNLAVGGYNTHQELEMLRTRGFGFEPDLVILGYDHNDPRRILGRKRPPIPDDYGENFLSSELLRYLARKFYSRPQLRFGNRVDGYISGGKSWDDHLEALTDIARECRERGIPVLVVIYDAGIKREEKESSKHYAGLHAALNPLWQDTSYYVLDCYDLFQDLVRERGWQDTQSIWVSIEPRDGHPNPEGHLIIAEAIIKVIEENDLLP